ncbi:MAG: DUF72 domain-containing protein [Verrucomicrobium sp.]|nr:DUF72 domain-containing protein [Verrucomicrobium sp.]
MTAPLPDLRIGCSSWLDPEFIVHWYPREVKADERLAWYADHFDYVEVNSSFYAVPEKTTAAKWARQTPADFLFDAKLHRALSRHITPAGSLPPALRPARGDAETPIRLDRALERDLAQWTREQFEPLTEAGRLGAFLLQLAPHFTPQWNRLEELDGLIEDLSPLPLAVEVRHRGWLAPGRREHTLSFLAARGITLVSVDTPPIDHDTALPPDDHVTQPELAYLRLHGRNRTGFVEGKTVAERFNWRYEEAELDGLTARIAALAKRAKKVRVAANNNCKDYAPRAALALRQKLGLPPRRPRQGALL